MKILFCQGASIISKAIMNVTGEPISHVALNFGLFVMHANFLGVHIEWFPNFIKRDRVFLELERINSEASDNVEDMTRINSLLDKYEFSFYDFGALLFVGLSLLLRRWFKLPLPKVNLWQMTGMFDCTEWVSEFLDGEEDSMITPYQLYLKLKQTGKWRDSTNA